VTAALLELDKLRAGYGHVEVLHGISLSVQPGRMVAIVGPNGAGKTTLMGAVMGLLPRRGGTVRYLGDTAGATEALVMSGAVLVPEQRALFTDMSVEDNLLLGFYPRRRAGERDARPALREVFGIFPRLEERRRQLAGTLSGGERQMLALGRALMGRPR
jgi:branched-chain amino acid transport system ATP-binding protein